MALSAGGGIRPDVYVGFEGFSDDWVRPVYGPPAATPATRKTPVNGRDKLILEGTREPELKLGPNTAYGGNAHEWA